MTWFVGLDTMVAVELPEDTDMDEVIRVGHLKILAVLAEEMQPATMLDWNIEFEEM